MCHILIPYLYSKASADAFPALTFPTYLIQGHLQSPNHILIFLLFSVLQNKKLESHFLQMTRVSSTCDVTHCSRQLYSRRRWRKDHTAGESCPPLPSTARISSVVRSRTCLVIHPWPTRTASCLTYVGRRPGSCCQPAPASPFLEPSLLVFPFQRG